MTQSGRCARGGEPGECILFYSGQDVVTNQFFIDNNQDNQELDPLTRGIVQERDRDRLRKMTFYCITNECLRDYILRYFGEYGSNYCEITQLNSTITKNEGGTLAKENVAQVQNDGYMGSGVIKYN